MCACVCARDLASDVANVHPDRSNVCMWKISTGAKWGGGRDGTGWISSVLFPVFHEHLTS